MDSKTTETEESAESKTLEFRSFHSCQETRWIRESKPVRRRSAPERKRGKPSGYRCHAYGGDQPSDSAAESMPRFWRTLRVPEKISTCKRVLAIEERLVRRTHRVALVTRPALNKTITDTRRKLNVKHRILNKEKLGDDWDIEGAADVRNPGIVRRPEAIVREPLSRRGTAKTCQTLITYTYTMAHMSVAVLPITTTIIDFRFH
uniref:OSJNBa0071I13.14 protein n=1 Tax=Oryza sativa subsp. japonica TaxID=39947 RepID=Q7XPX9_ORYSJ|nr:OSJNBa0071I13.14 [Oryza sativa Japonica Group]